MGKFSVENISLTIELKQQYRYQELMNLLSWFPWDLDKERNKIFFANRSESPTASFVLERIKERIHTSMPYNPKKIPINVCKQCDLIFEKKKKQKINTYIPITNDV